MAWHARRRLVSFTSGDALRSRLMPKISPLLAVNSPLALAFPLPVLTLALLRKKLQYWRRRAATSPLGSALFKTESSASRLSRYFSL